MDIVTDLAECGDPPDVIVNVLDDDFAILDLKTLPARSWAQRHVPRPREWWCGSLVYRRDVVTLAARMTDAGLYVP